MAKENDKTRNMITSVLSKPKTRREFLKLVGAGGAGVVTLGFIGGLKGPLVASPAAPVKIETPIKQAIGHVEYNPYMCAGCQICMAICSLSHDGAVCPDLARMQVIAPVLKPFDMEGYTCQQCDGPECLYVCPTGALHVDETTGARVIDAKTCIGCQLCVQACPQYPNSPIRYDTVRKIAVKCDLCGGDPQCVKACPKSVDISPSYIPEKDRALKFIKHSA